jgi:hypothetical protein
VESDGINLKSLDSSCSIEVGLQAKKEISNPPKQENTKSTFGE